MKKVGKIIAIIASVIVTLVFAYVVFGNIFIKRPSWIFDQPIWIEGEERLLPFIYVLAVLIYFVAIIIIYRIIIRQKDIEKIHRLILFWTFIFICCFCILVPTAPYADQANIIRIPAEIWEGTCNEFNKNMYLDLYPNNIGTVLLYFPFFFICAFNYQIGSIVGVILIRLVQALLTVLMIKKLGEIFEMIFKGKEKYKTLLYLICITSIPLITMVNLMYGDVLAMCMFVFGSYYLIRYFEKSKNPKDIFFAFALVGVGNILRSIGVIVLISMIIYCLYQESIKILWKPMLLGICLYISTQISSDLLAALIFNLPLPIGQNGMPVTSWIQMGLTGPLGYWTGYGILDVWMNDSLTIDEKKAIYLENIINQVKTLGFDGILDLFKDKMHYLFGEGTFQIELNGLGVEETQPYNGVGAWYYNTVITNILANDDNMHAITNYQYTHNMFIIGLSVIGIIKGIKKPNLFVIVIAGFIAFYCIWELKSRYIFVILPMMLFMATYGLSHLIDLFDKKQRKINKNVDFN